MWYGWHLPAIDNLVSTTLLLARAKTYRARFGLLSTSSERERKQRERKERHSSEREKEGMRRTTTTTRPLCLTSATTMSTKDLVELLQQKTTEDAYDYMQEGRPNGWLQESAGDEEQTNFAVYCVIWKFMPAARTTGVASFPLNRERFKYRVMEAFGMTKAAVDKHICTKDFLKKLAAMLPELCTAAALYDNDDEGAWWTVVSSNGNAAGGGDQTDKVEKQRDIDLLEAELQRVKAELQRANARIQLLHDDTTTLGSAVASLELQRRRRCMVDRGVVEWKCRRRRRPD